MARHSRNSRKNKKSRWKDNGKMRYRAANSTVDPLEFLASSVFTQNTLQVLDGSDIVRMMGDEAARKVFKHILETQPQVVHEVQQEIREEASARQAQEDARPPPECPAGRHRFRKYMYRSLDGRPEIVTCDFCNISTRNPTGYEVVNYNYQT
jgi:hypothetical protein